ncbi:MAG: calcium-binding protein [Pleurocapsa sp.]
MWYSPEDDLTYIELINGFSSDNLVRDILPAYREGINDSTLEFNITEQEGSITIPVLNDGETEGEEIASFSLDTGEGYAIDPDNNSGEFTITDNSDTTTPEESNVGYGIFPNEVLEGDNIRFFFEVSDDLIPDDGSGIYLYLDSDTPNILSQLDLDSATGGESFIANADNSGFAVRIFEFDSTVEIPVIIDEITEEPIDVTFKLKTRDEISEEDLAIIEADAQIDDYELNLQMFSSTVNISDNDSTGNPDPSSPIGEPTEPEANNDLEPLFGTVTEDIIEVEGSNQLIFAGDVNDLVDATTGEGSNRIYAGNGDDTLILGSSDRVLAGFGDDASFATSGGDNTITGGAGADQFWIASAELPDSANIITDFTAGEDVIGLAGLGNGFEDVSITTTEGDALISAYGSDLAILQGIEADILTADNFTFFNLYF